MESILALFFNLQTLEEESGGDVLKFIAMLEFHYKGITLAKNIKQQFKPSRRSLAGGSFILNPEPLFKDTSDPIYKVQYIKLAARRDYGLYRIHKVKTLNISFFPDLNVEAAKHNPLLIVTKQELIFKYE